MKGEWNYMIRKSQGTRDKSDQYCELLSFTVVFSLYVTGYIKMCTYFRTSVVVYNYILSAIMEGTTLKIKI